MSRILVGAPIRQKPKILNEFLKGLERVDKGNNSVSYYFVDDNTDEESKVLLDGFSEKNNQVIIKKAEDILSGIDDNNYICDSQTHHWNTENIERITIIKDCIIEHCISEEYDYLFLIDSDIVIDHRSLIHLVSRNVEIVSNVFYTQWSPGSPLVPQCFWIPDVYQQFKSFNKPLPFEEATQIKTDLYARIRVPGIYQVDGLGACTLIKTSALKKGVRFKSIPNLALPGEDRHFCVRAGALGINLYIDSVYPAYHIFREEYLSRVEEFVNNGFSFDMCKTQSINCKSHRSNKKSDMVVIALAKRVRRFFINRIRQRKQAEKEIQFKNNRNTQNDMILLQMTVHNECGKYLERCLESVKDLIDYYVIIDDASTDETVALCEHLLHDFPHTIVKNETSMFHEEYKLRTKLWNEAIKHNPGWIMSLDADEVLQDNGAQLIRALIKNEEVDGFSFKYYDMWNENEYREDKFWHSHKGFRPYLMRYIPEYEYSFKQTNQHCGSFPLEYYQFKHANVNVKIKHYGWADESSRKSKYKRYMKLDPDGKYGNLEQYNSILDPKPNLLPFSDLPDGL